jgi:hypothetical protein
MFTKVHLMGDQKFIISFPRASEGTLSRWSQLHLQSLASSPFSRRVDDRQAPGRNKYLPNLYHMMKKTVCTYALSWIRIV